MSSFTQTPPAPVETDISAEKIKLKKTAKRFEGTYKQVPRIEWTELLVNHFGNPDWLSLYPIAEGSERVDADGQTWGTPKGLLPPRTACKLFHDGVHILKMSEDSTKYMQDRIPEMCHKQFKKKQWRKQFFEAARRVCCRLAIGLGFKPNCVAEDVFIHAILNMSFELGWNRLKEFIDPLPMTDKDRDFGRVHKLAANEEILSLTKGETGGATKKSGGSEKKSFQLDLKVLDCKQWFRCYETKLSTMFDHIVEIGSDETDGWSVSTGSTISTASGTQSPIRSGKARSESMGSQFSDGNDGDPNTWSLPAIQEEPKGLAGGSKLSASNLAQLAEELSKGKP